MPVHAPTVFDLPPDHGLEEGHICGRGDACPGVLETAEVEDCSCHIDPPCSACTTDRTFCPECGWQAEELVEWEAAMDARTRPEHYRPPVRDRSDETTSTYTSSPFNSTPFTRCCQTAAIGTDRCPVCKARITHHDDGLAARRREVGPGNCLICAKRRLKKHEPLGTPGTCCC